MAFEDDQQQQKVRVNLATKYPEVVLCVGKICFGEKARKKIPRNSKQDQKYTLACAVCALLNSGGGVVKAEIENENYKLERDMIGLDLEQTFRSLLLFPDWGKYLDFEQRDNYILIFIKTWSSENTASTRAKPRLCSLSTGLYTKCGASLSHMNSTEAFEFLKEKQDEAKKELSPGPPAKIRNTRAVEGDTNIINNTVVELFNRDQLQHGETLTFTESGNVEFKDYSTEKILTRVKEILPQYIAGFANASDLSKFSETFRLELSLTEGPPLTKPVYSHQGLDNIDDLCKQLFPVEPHRIIYTPEKLSEDLLQEHPGLDILMENQLKQLSEGVLIFSRSWAVEVGLPENQDIICDVLLIAEDRPPILYTICKHHISPDLFEYSRRIAWRLKEKLVNTGGYIHKLCVIPKLLILPPKINCGKEWDLNIQEMYPQNYSLIKSDNLKALLRALTVVLLGFKSFLSDRVGSEFLNLLTIKQYQLLSENLHKTKKLYVYGLPGTGKTIVALKIIEKIRTMLQCKKEEVLYVCENKPLRDFVWQKNICQAVTRVAFLKGSFNDVKHIIIDEAQNFQDGDGDWHEKALRLTSSADLPEPGFFWIFLDYLQTSHRFPTGLPEAKWHDPLESLTKVVRNARNIYSYLKENMETIVTRSTLNIPKQRLTELLHRATCVHAVQGSREVRLKRDINEIAKYVAKHCHTYLKKGYSKKDIAILCYTEEEAIAFRGILASEMRKSNISLRNAEEGPEEHAILDSVRRFSGLERSIVFGIIPQNFPFQEMIFENILVCVASRANLNLHLLFYN
ncbi:schlafen family member 13-like isoform 2-T4 [Alca torda]